MPSDFAPEYGLWLESVVVLAAGTAVIVGLAALVSRWVGSAVWRRTIWQVATLGLLGLVLVECTGTAAGLVRLCSVHAPPSETEAATPSAPVDEPTEAFAPLVDVKRPVERPRGIDLAAFSFDGGEFTAPDVAAFGDAAPVPAESWGTTVFGHFDFGPDDGGRNFRAVGDFRAVGVADRVVEPDVAEDGELAEVVPAEPIGRSPEPTSAAAASLPAPAAPSHVRPPGVWWPGMVWLLGTAVVAGRAVFARLLLCALRRRHAPLGDADLCRCVRVLARRLGIRRPVCVLQSGALGAPVAFGSFRPTVLLPAGFTEEFDRRQQEAMLAHELAHLRAGDPAWQLAADLACAVLWWHPLAWWSRRRLRWTSEAAADEASLLVPGGPGVLASCLVAMGRRFSSRPRLGWLSIEGPGFRSALGRRVERLLNLRTRPWRAPGRGRSVCVKTLIPVALVIVAVTCTAWVRPQATLNEGGTTMKVLSSSWRRSLAAVALVTLWGVTSGDAVAAEGEGHEGEGPKLEGKLVLEKAEGEARGHAEAEAREREAREREEAEAREREAREREEAEVREREGREREEAEARERERREREEAEAREREAHRAELQQMRRALAEKLERVQAEMRELRDGQDAEARELRGMLAELQEKLRHVNAELGEGERERPDRPDEHRREGEVRERPDRPRVEEERIMALRREHRALEERAAAVRRKLEGAVREHGEGHPAVRELAGELGRLEGRMREIAAAARGEGPRPDRPRPDRPRPDQPRPPELRQLEELERQIHRLSEAGRHEEAEALKRRGRELMEAMRRRQADRPPERDRPGPGPDMERRIHHLRVAVENLHAAGLHDQAEMLARQLERMMHGGPGPDRPHPEMRPMGPPPEGPERMIHELRGQVEELRHQMEEMRRVLQELLERERER